MLHYGGGWSVWISDSWGVVPKAQISEIRTVWIPISLQFRFQHSLDFSCLVFRHSLYSQCPKSERSDFRQCRNPNILVFELAVFGFQSFGPGLYRSVPNYFVQTQIFKFTNLQICVWNPNILFRLSYMCWDFRHFCLFKVIWYRTEGDCLKSKHVRISDVYCTVSIQNPDWSGFGLSTCVRFPDINGPNCLKTRRNYSRLF